jgi:hypothetical protein
VRAHFYAHGRNCELIAAHRLELIPDSPLQQGNVEHGEVLGTDEIDTRALLFRRRLAGNLKALLPPVVGRSGICGETSRDNVQHRADFLQQLIEIRSPPM